MKEMQLEDQAVSPKYLQLYEQLHEQIRHGELKPGDRLPSFSELRSLYGAMPATVERTYARLEKENLIERQPRRGIFVAQPESMLTATLGIAGSPAFREQREFSFIHLNQGIQKAVAEYGQRLITLDTINGWDKDSFRGVDGILLSGHPPKTNRLIVQLKPPHMPCVTMFNVAEGMTSVLADDYGAAKMAMRYFLEHGHRRIACLIEDTGDSTQIMRDRFAGYQDALQEAEIDAPSKWGRMVDGSMVLRGKLSHLEWGREQMRIWLKEDFRKLRCTAILAQNDHVAIGIMQVLHEANIDVPGQVSVMGFDGTELCDHATPRLSSMQMPLEQMGLKAVESLVNQIEKGSAEEQILVLPAKLREGDSVASL